MSSAVSNKKVDAQDDATIPYNSREEKRRYGWAVFDQDVPLNTTFMKEDRATFSFQAKWIQYVRRLFGSAADRKVFAPTSNCVPGGARRAICRIEMVFGKADAA